MEYKGSYSDLTDRQKQVLDIFVKFNSANKHKMLPIPIFKKHI
jgi:hypothetical protein